MATALPFSSAPSSAGVPFVAVMASTYRYFTTALNYFAPDEVFSFLLASSGAVALLVYLAIAVFTDPAQADGSSR